MEEWLANMFGPADAAVAGPTPPPAAPVGRRVGGGLNAPLTPEEIASITAVAEGRGVPDAELQAWLALPRKDAIKMLQTVMGRAPPKPPKAGAQKFDRDRLKQLYPEYAGEIDAASDGALSSIVSSLVGNKIRGGDKKGLDREAAAGLLPGMEEYIPGMSDADVSDAVQEAYEAQSQGGVGFREREGGASLKIVQDASFQRSGLKSGDTVCIRIP